MIRILEELEKGEDHQDPNRNLIILDDFMSHMFNAQDSLFLCNLKEHIKKRNVTAILLTSNREAACRLLSQGKLGVIVPMATNQQISQLRDANPSIDPHSPLTFLWEQQASMVWDKDELKKAFQHTIAFRELNEAKQNSIKECFEGVYDQLSQHGRDTANPITIARKFDETQTEITTPRAGANGGVEDKCRHPRYEQGVGACIVDKLIVCLAKRTALGLAPRRSKGHKAEKELSIMAL